MRRCHSRVSLALNPGYGLFRWNVRAGCPEIAMLIDGKWMCSVWVEPDGWSVGIIDQTKLPHAVRTLRLATVSDAASAISSMQTRGAPLIGAVAAYGLCLALRVDA